MRPVIRQILNTPQEGLLKKGLTAEYRMDQRSLLKWSEPLLSQISTKSAGVTQANFNENGLSNGIQYPPIAQLDYAYASGHTAVNNNTYTLTTYVVMNDNSIPNPSAVSTSGDFCLLIGGTVALTNIIVSQVAGNLYKVTGVKNSATWSDATSFGVVRYATQSGKGFRVTGYQLELGSVPTPYQKTTDLQTLWNSKKTPISVSNLVVNGDFSNGVSGWEPSSATISVDSNELTVTASASTGLCARIFTPNSIVGNKYYGHAKVKATSSLVQLRLGATPQTHSGSGNYERLSVIHTAINTIHTANIQDTRTSGWNGIKVKEVFAIDLTALFGAGNEPTLAQCDYLFSQWHDGTKQMDLPLNNGQLGSTTGVDTNDPTWTGQGLSFTTDDYVKVTFPSGVLPSGSSPSTVMAVYNSTVTADQDAVMWGEATVLGLRGVGVNTPTRNFRSTTGDDLNSGIDTANYVCVTESYTAGNGKLYTNLTQYAGVNAGIENTPAVTSLYIGARNGINTFLTGSVAYVAIYNRALSYSEIKQNYKYIKKLLAIRGVVLP